VSVPSIAVVFPQDVIFAVETSSWLPEFSSFLEVDL
jgi:hypothetical protein